MSLKRPSHSRRQASVDYPRYPPLNSATQQPPAHFDMVSQAILASDYDSDNQGYASDFPAVSAPLTRTREELNLAALQKWNSDIISIISVAPYATIYDFAAVSNEWQKSGLVGTLFICQLCPGQFGEDRYRAIVLNRSGLENFEAELRQSERGGVAMQGDFVEISREDPDTGDTKVNAIYIYAEHGTSTAGSRKGNGELMVALANAAKVSRDAAEAQSHASPMQAQMYPQLTSYQSHESEPEPVIEQIYVPKQPTPGPPLAPAPARQVDLLALLKGHQSDAESVVSRPAENSNPTNTHLLDLFRNSGAQL